MSNSADVPLGERRVSEKLTNVTFGKTADGTDALVLALLNDENQGVAVALNREEAEAVFDRFCEEMRKRGWLQ